MPVKTLVYLDKSGFNRPFDYTEWRKDNLFVGETVDSLMDKAEALYH